MSISKDAVWLLKERQALPLDVKIGMSIRRIKEWYRHWKGNVYIAFSGGKDSTVLLDIVRSIYPGIPAVFSDTGLEFPEIRTFVKTFGNVTVVKPKKNFRQVVREYGWPLVSKHTARCISQVQNATDKNKATVTLRLTGVRSDGTRNTVGKIPAKWLFLVDAPFKISERCCDWLKKKPLMDYAQQTKCKSFVGTMAVDSKMRKSLYLRQGCNAFESKHPISTPLGFWTEQDVLQYIKTWNLPYAPVYGTIIENAEGRLRCSGQQRTGCIFCGFGVHLEWPNRFQRLQKSHPKKWDYVINKMGMGVVLDYAGIPYKAESLAERTMREFTSKPL